MITLSTPPVIKSVLGGSDTVSYDRFILSQITHDPVAQTINGIVRLSSSSDPTMNPIYGRFKIAGSVLEIEVEQLDFYRRVSLNVGQVSAYRSWITASQDQIEQGFVSLGIVSGTQAAGV